MVICHLHCFVSIADELRYVYVSRRLQRAPHQLGHPALG